MNHLALFALLVSAIFIAGCVSSPASISDISLPNRQGQVQPAPSGFKTIPCEDVSSCNSYFSQGGLSSEQISTLGIYCQGDVCFARA